MMSEPIQMLPVPDLPESYSDFAREMLQKVAAATGVTYEQMSAVWESPTVSWSRDMMKLWMEQTRREGLLPLDPWVNAYDYDA